MSAVEELKQEIKKLPTSAPIFKIRKDANGWSGPRIILGSVSAVGFPKPFLKDYVNPIGALAKAFHKERFDVGARCWVIDQESIFDNVRQELKNFVRGFLIHNFQDNPELTRWYEYHALSSTNLERTYFETFLGLYKYSMQNELKPDADKHRENVKGLLDLIFQRDFREHQLPQRKRRRRRRR